MRYYRRVESGAPRLFARNGEVAYDLTTVHDDLRSVTDLLAAGKFTGQSVDEVTRSIISHAESVSPSSLVDRANRPVVPDEVWAAGVTYEISEQARENESTLPAVYRNVYESERPEIFFKATANRTVGPSEAIGVRGDSEWNVPEPELGVVIYDGGVVGYTIGNDVSSRDLEGANPLYLPQAKVYDRCCSIGPCLATADAISDPHDLEISMAIHRDGEPLYEASTSTAEMVRSCEELVSYYRRSNDLPEMAVLLTGTSLVPPEEVSLSEGDTVRIEIDDIGSLENPVVTV